MAIVDTPGRYTIAEVSAFLKVAPAQCLKTLLVKGTETAAVALVVRGDHELNVVKAERLPGVAAPLAFASDAEVRALAGAPPGSIGPVGLSVPIYVDHSAAHAADFICGANQADKHYRGVNWGRDLPEPQAVDLRNVVEGDPSPDGRGRLAIKRGIEVGHIFQLGKKYSQAMNATVLDEAGAAVVMTMGCYGIGVSRVVAAAIEQNHDAQGIIWPASIAPFEVALLPMNMQRSERVRTEAEQLYERLHSAGIETLFDDRNERPGVMFADSELIGIPHRIVIGERGLDRGMLEYKGRRETESQDVPLETIIEFLQTKRAAQA